MRQIFKRLFKMIVGYGAVYWAGPFISFIFTPIITRFLNPSDYGVADFALTVASAMGTLALFALPQAIAAHFNDRPEDEEWQQRLTGSALGLALGFAVPIGLLLFLSAPQLAQAAFGNQRYTHLFQLIGASVVFGISSSILIAVAQAALRVRWGMLFSAITVSATVAGNLLFIVLLRLGATGMILTAVGVGVSVSTAAFIVMGHTIGKPSWVMIKTIFFSGMWLFPTMIAAWSLQVIDRFFLIEYVSTETLGHYAIANKVASLLYVMMAPLYSAWTPLALSIQHDPTAKHYYATMARYLISMVLLGGLGLGLFAPEILLIFTQPAYLPAAPYVGFLVYIHIFSGISTVLYTSALAGKQLKAVSLTTIIGAGVNILLNIILIPLYGLWGATLATVIGYAMPTIFLYFLLRTRFPVPYPVIRLTAALLVQSCLLWVSLPLLSSISPIHIIIKMFLCLLLLLFLIVFGVISRVEIQQAWLVLRELGAARTHSIMTIKQ